MFSDSRTMITRQEELDARTAALSLFEQSGFSLGKEERSRIEVADFGLSRLRIEGAQILTLVQTHRLGVKLIALTSRQTLPEHWHPRVGPDPGKEETVRVIFGTLLFYVAGSDTLSKGGIPAGKDEFYTARHEITMHPGDKIYVAPGEKHWFQAAEGGCVAFSFSSVTRDILDRFTDPEVRRITEVRQ
jgi:D-lyxose ketol-isomerase